MMAASASLIALAMASWQAALSQSSIDATPKVKSALEAKGMSSAQLIAASLQPNGALTLITKKAS